MQKTYNLVPKGQVLWESHYDSEKNLIGFLTSDPHKENWTWFSVKNGKITGKKSGKNPKEARK